MYIGDRRGSVDWRSVFVDFASGTFLDVGRLCVKHALLCKRMPVSLTKVPEACGHMPRLLRNIAESLATRVRAEA